MSPRPLLLFETLLPSSDAEADAACATFIETEGRRDGQTLPVVLIDPALTARADFRAVFERDPELARLVLSDCEPEKSLALVRVLLEASPGLSVELVTRDGSAPAELPSERVRVVGPAEVEPIEVDHYGSLHREILANGVTWFDEPTPVCRRPQRVSLLDKTPDELLLLFERHHDSASRAFGGTVPERARQLVIEAASLFDDPTSARSLFDRLARGEALLTRIRYRGQGSARGVLSAIREAIRWQLRHGDSPFELMIDPSNDPWVERAAEAIAEHGISDEALGALHRAWSGLRTAETPTRVAQRAADQCLRRTTFRLIAEEQRTPLGESSGLARQVERLLGPGEQWLPECRRYLNQSAPRVVVVPTWQCELRCTYCTIPKQDGRVMSQATLERAIELLLSSEAANVELHFFGGEPFLEWPLLQHACEWGSEAARRTGSSIRFIFTTNGYSLERPMVEWLAGYDVRFQLSIDGDSATQNAFRRTLTPGLDSYARSPAGHAAWFRESGVSHDVIQVVHPRNAEQMDRNFFHLADMGYRRIQVNFALGTRWPKDAVEHFAAGLHRIGLGLERRWQSGDDIALVNLGESLQKVRTNVEVTVDWDGSVFGSNAFLYIPKYRDEFLLGHLDELGSFDRYAIGGLSGDDLLRHWYKDGMAENNQQVGAVVQSFVRWMRARHPELGRERA